MRERRTIVKFHPLIQWAMRVYRSNGFHSVILFCISLNTICLSLDQFPSLPRQQVEIIAFLNLLFSFIFLFEMLITHLAIGVIKYWTQIMTAFDGVIVVCSLLEFYVRFHY